LTCGSCGIDLPAGARFCPECGGKPADGGGAPEAKAYTPAPAAAAAPAARSAGAAAIVGRPAATSAPAPTPTPTYTSAPSYTSAPTSESKDGVCHGCHQSISSRIVTAMEHQWHPDCFKCAGCGSPFATGGGGGSFMIKDDRPYCTACSDSQMGSCASCGGKLSGPVLTALEKQWHPACFVCGGCRKPFTGGKFKMSASKPGIPYCDDCVKTA